MATFNWIILGTGHAASKFVRDLKFLPNHRVSHVGSRSTTRAREFIDYHKLSSEAITLATLFDIKNADAIYIATDSSLHFTCVNASIRLKLPILCEKPLALNINDVEELYKIASDQNVMLIEGLWTLFLPGLYELKKLFDLRENMSSFSMKASYGKKFEYDPAFRLFSKEKSGGALYDLGIYPVASSVFLFGEPTLKEIEITRSQDGLVLSFAAVLSFAGNNEAYIQSSLIENLPNKLILTDDLNEFEVESPFIGNSSIHCVRGAEVLPVYSNSEMRGIGLWKEAEFVERISNGFENSGVTEIQKISLSTHRILHEIESS